MFNVTVTDKFSMKTRLDLGDVLADLPQQRALLSLFEEDANQLKQWTRSLLEGVDMLTHAQSMATEATRLIASTMASFKDRRFVLDDVDLDMPQLTTRLALALREQANGMELLREQLTNCVRYPVAKISTELNKLVDKAGEKHNVIQEELLEAEEKYMKTSRKDSKKSSENLGDLTIARNRYNSEVIDYVTRLNSLQSSRYTLLIEPIVSLLHAYKSYHSMSTDFCKSSEFGQLLTDGQEKMQSVVRAEELARKNSGTKLDAIISRLNDDDFDVAPGCSSHHKQGYLRMRVKSGIFTSNWERFFVYVQGNTLMYQKPDELVSVPLTDSLHGCTIAEAPEADRRFVFIVTQAHAEHAVDKQLTLQACSQKDLLEWINVIRNIALMNPRDSPNTSDELEDHKNFDISLHPMQFDLLSIGQLSSPSSTSIEEQSKHIKIRFLGSVEVPSAASGGEPAVQASIDKVLLARKVHQIEPPHPFHLTCESRRVLISDAVDSSILKAFFNFADIVLWMVSRRDDHHLALITSTRDSATQDGIRFTCSVFEVPDGASEVCNLLSQQTATAFQEVQAELGALQLKKDEERKQQYESFNPINE